MTEDADEVTTDRDQIRTAAEARGVVPVRIERGEGSGDETADLALVATPRERGERVSWPAFFDRLDEAGLAVRIGRGEEDVRDLDVISRGRDPADDGGTDERAGERTADRAAEQTTEPETTDSNQIATSDTGDDEPVVFDRTEADVASAEADVASADADDPSTASVGDSARGPADTLVLDEIHEHSLSPTADDREGEYVVFENEGEATLDLSGWTVANEAGATYQFPAGVALAPSDRLTLHSGAGEDGGGELYWHADGPVWGNQGDTVIVETDAGERVLEQPYEGGR